MKKYNVHYSYNHGCIEADMDIEAESPEEAKEKAFQYAGVDHVISAKEIHLSKEAETVYNAICALAENPKLLEELCKKYDPHGIAGEFERLAGIC